MSKDRVEQNLATNVYHLKESAIARKIDKNAANEKRIKEKANQISDLQKDLKNILAKPIDAKVCVLIASERLGSKLIYIECRCDDTLFAFKERIRLVTAIPIKDQMIALVDEFLSDDTKQLSYYEIQYAQRVSCADWKYKNMENSYLRSRW